MAESFVTPLYRGIETNILHVTINLCHETDGRQ